MCRLPLRRRDALRRMPANSSRPRPWPLAASCAGVRTAPARAPPIRPDRPAPASVPATASSGSRRRRAPCRAAPPASASGLTWMAAGTLPEAPLMRPSVTSATRKPLPCSTPSGGVSLCSSGMPLARGPCQRTTQTTSRSSSPAVKAASSASCESNTRAGASTIQRSSGTDDTLITPRPSCRSAASARRRR